MARLRRSVLELVLKSLATSKHWYSFSVNPSNRIGLYLLSIVTLIGPNSAQAELVVQFHCAGGSQLAADARLVALNRARALPSSTQMQDMAITKLSALLTGRLGFRSNALSVSLMKPLLKDVLENESICSIGEANGSSPSFLMAVHLEAQRAQLWQDKCS